jgi:hypothetical protein
MGGAIAEYSVKGRGTSPGEQANTNLIVSFHVPINRRALVRGSEATIETANAEA